MFNSANAITNIELAEDQLKESLSSIKKADLHGTSA